MRTITKSLKKKTTKSTLKIKSNQIIQPGAKPGKSLVGAGPASPVSAAA
jgi:hypothetical protein